MLIEFKRVSLITVKHTGATITRHSCSVDVVLLLYFSECFIENVLHVELRWQERKWRKGPMKDGGINKRKRRKGPNKVGGFKRKGSVAPFFFSMIIALHWPWRPCWTETLTSGQWWWYQIVILRLRLAGPWYCHGPASTKNAFVWLVHGTVYGLAKH